MLMSQQKKLMDHQRQQEQDLQSELLHYAGSFWSMMLAASVLGASALFVMLLPMVLDAEILDERSEWVVNAYYCLGASAFSACAAAVVGSSAASARRGPLLRGTDDAAKMRVWQRRCLLVLTLGVACFYFESALLVMLLLGGSGRVATAVVFVGVSGLALAVALSHVARRTVAADDGYKKLAGAPEKVPKRHRHDYGVTSLASVAPLAPFFQDDAPEEQEVGVRPLVPPPRLPIQPDSGFTSDEESEGDDDDVAPQSMSQLFGFGKDAEAPDAGGMTLL